MHCNNLHIWSSIFILWKRKQWKRQNEASGLCFNLTPLSALKRRQPSPYLFSYSILSLTFNALTRGEAARIKVALLSYSIRVPLLSFGYFPPDQIVFQQVEWKTLIKIWKVHVLCARWRLISKKCATFSLIYTCLPFPLLFHCLPPTSCNFFLFNLNQVFSLKVSMCYR